MLEGHMITLVYLGLARRNVGTRSLLAMGAPRAKRKTIPRDDVKPPVATLPAENHLLAIADIRRSIQYQINERDHMALKHSFRFLDTTRSNELRRQLERANLQHTVEPDGSIRYS